MGTFGTAGYATSSGWFPDPTGRHEARFWDGAAWTDHIADGGVTGVDPQTPARPTLATAVPANEPRPLDGGNPLLDLKIKHSRGWKRQLRLDTETLIWGDEQIPLRAVEAVAYTVTRVSTNGIPTTTNYKFTVWVGSRQTRVYFSVGSLGRRERKDCYAGVFHALAGTSARVIEPRLRRQVADRVASGETVDVAGVRISRHGFTPTARFKGTNLITWDRFAGATFKAGSVAVSVLAGDGKSGKRQLNVPMGEPNAVLLPELLQQCAERA
jgi:hypothetical protein